MTFHYAKFKNDELIVLGYNVRNNDCYLVRLVGLPGSDQEELRRIANSESAQNTPYLTNVITHVQKADTNKTWWAYLMEESVRRNSPVFKLPLKEIQDSLDPEQRAIFKGYGKNVMENRRLSVEKLDSGKTTEPDKIDTMMATIIEEGRQNRQMMMDLIKALVPQASHVTSEEVEKPISKKVVIKKKISKIKKEQPEISQEEFAAAKFE